MRVLIATGIYPPDIGGPAIYAKNLSEEFKRQGHDVAVVVFSDFKNLPSGIRHLFYLVKLFFSLGGVDFILSLDTFSVGLPSVIAAKLFGKKVIIRTGGDFLWESYEERTGNLMTIPEFYEKRPSFNLKEKTIFYLSKYLLKTSSAVAFNTNWQKKIFEEAYELDVSKTFIVPNFWGGKISDENYLKKNFLFAGRKIKIKNTEVLTRAFEKAKKERDDIELELINNLTHEQLLEKMRSCYAVILPSLSDIGPNFILDAMALNRPFILTEATGFYDDLKDVGMFINPKKEDDITEKILMMSQDDVYKKYKERVRSFNKINSWADVANDFLSIYKKI